MLVGDLLSGGKAMMTMIPVELLICEDGHVCGVTGVVVIVLSVMHCRSEISADLILQIHAIV